MLLSSSPAHTVALLHWLLLHLDGGSACCVGPIDNKSMEKFHERSTTDTETSKIAHLLCCSVFSLFHHLYFGLRFIFKAVFSINSQKKCVLAVFPLPEENSCTILRQCINMVPFWCQFTELNLYGTWPRVCELFLVLKKKTIPDRHQLYLLGSEWTNKKDNTILCLQVT